MSTPPEIKTGYHRHFKGTLYYVLGPVTLLEGARVAWCVQYVDVEMRPLVRPLYEFTQDVEWPDGVTRPRFVAVDE